MEYKRHCYKYLGIQYPRERVQDWNIRHTATSILVYNISQRMSYRLEYKRHCNKYLGIQNYPREWVKDWNIRDIATSILVYNISQGMS